jgi:glucokinase
VERGFVYFFPNIPGWKNTPLKALLEKRLKLPVFVDNDASVMALAEFEFGAGRGAKNVIALTLGTGVGGGLVIDGKLFHGPRYSAAEIGHLVINEDGPRCGCGSRGCVETYVGSGYFVCEVKRRLKKGAQSVLKKWVKEGREMTPLLAAQAARRGDVFSKKIWQETGAHLGTALAGLLNILNPEKIILGGGIAQNGGLLFRPLRAALNKKAFPIAARSVRVVPAKLGVDAGLIGAAALAFAEQGDL